MHKSFFTVLDSSKRKIHVNLDNVEYVEEGMTMGGESVDIHFKSGEKVTVYGEQCLVVLKALEISISKI